MDVAGIGVEVLRKDIKNLHLGVYPPNGRVRVAAPLAVNDDAVRLAVITRLSWIRQRRKEFAEQVRQSRREMVTGESHYYRGRRYRLHVVKHDGPSRVRLVNNAVMELAVRPGSNRDKREKALDQWYRAKLRDSIPALITKWEPVVDEEVAGWGIRKMKTRWGSCNAEARRIWVNLELAKKPVSCLEYILVHEMVHFLERHHNDRFRDLMDDYIPTWRIQRDELNRAPLAHEEWSY